MYRAHRILDDVDPSEAPIRQGLLSVVPSLDSVGKDISGILDDLSEAVGDMPASSEGGPLNMLHLAVADGKMTDISAVKKEKAKLELLCVRTVNVLIPSEKKKPLYYTFPQIDKYKEDPLRRNMRPTFHHLLELGRLRKNF